MFTKKLEERIEKIERELGETEECSKRFYWFGGNSLFYKEKTIQKRLENIEDKIAYIEKYLKIQYRDETKVEKGYKPIKK